MSHDTDLSRYGEPTITARAKSEANDDTAHGARARIMETAYELFSRHGIRSVGIDRIIADSGVAKMSLYRHFASKADLVLAFLDLREERWTRDWLEVEIARLATTAHDRLLAIFDALDEWFHQDDFESCAFMRTLLEFNDPTDPIHQAAVHRLDVIRKMIETHAEQARTQDPENTSYQLQGLLMGAIVSATRGDLAAARRARAVAELVLADATSAAR
jgi:AcrR family transcriptional regulator